MATGFEAGAHQDLLAQARSIRNQMQEAGEDVLSNFNALTGDGLQGNAADATQQLGEKFNRTMQSVDEAIQTIEGHTTEFGDNMTSTDSNFANQIMG